VTSAGRCQLIAAAVGPRSSCVSWAEDCVTVSKAAFVRCNIAAISSPALPTGATNQLVDAHTVLNALYFSSHVKHELLTLQWKLPSCEPMAERTRVTGLVSNAFTWLLVFSLRFL